MNYPYIAHLNVRSLTPKYNEIKSILLENSYEILFLSETWLTDSTSNHFLNIDGYNLVRRDRVGRGEGVTFNVSNKLKYPIIPSNSDIEQLWISVTIKKYIFLV